MSSGQWDPSSYHSWPPDASIWGYGWGRGISDQTSAWPTDWPNVMMTCSSTTLTTRCLHWGWGCQRPTWGVGGIRGQWGLDMKNADGLLQSTLENSRWPIADNRTWAQVNGTQVHTILGHQMSLPGDCGAYGGDGVGHTSELTSAWPTSWWHVMLTCSSTTLDH